VAYVGVGCGNAQLVAVFDRTEREKEEAHDNVSCFFRETAA
jgi:hypothetical protein